MRDKLIELAVQTVQRPQEAAARILAYDLSRDALWTALALVAAFNTLIFSLTLMITGAPPMMPEVFSSPIAFFVIFAGMLVLTVHGFYWTGRAMGGQGDLGELLALTVWLQALRGAAQVGGLILVVVMPMLAPLYSLIIGILGFWILLHFISASLRLQSLMTAFAVIVVAALGLVFGLFILGSMIGLTAMGVAPNV